MIYRWFQMRGVPSITCCTMWSRRFAQRVSALD
jgi:hypothetical protein